MGKGVMEGLASPSPWDPVLPPGKKFYSSSQPLAYGRAWVPVGLLQSCLFGFHPL